MKSQAWDDDYEFVGTLERSETGRWAIKISQTGRLIEITCGDVVTVSIGGHWIRTRVEHDGSDYISMIVGIKFYRGMPVRM
jgi:hypothetical protein